LGRAVRQAQQAGNLDSLRGYEGSGGAGYWTGFQHLLRVDLGFQGRKYFPPPDPVNAMLSFGYSLLLKDVTAAVQLVGLDPYLGFFHTINYARPSLALDMMEEFRPVAVDSVVLTLVNEGRITAASFERTENPKLPLRLTEAAIDILIGAYEQRLAQPVAHADAGGQTAYRRVIELQVRRLARLVLGKARKYEPFTP
jgi:CRISPR-associated protein Cas1